MAGINGQQVYLPSPLQSETTGAVACAPVGTDAPTDARTVLPNTWNNGGYIDENGISLSISRSVTGIKDWSQSVVRKALSEYDGTIALTFLQVDEFACKAVFGDDNVNVTAATQTAGNITKVAIGAELPEIKSWCFTMKDEDRRVRVYVPRGQITEIPSNIDFVPTAANKYPGTLSTYDDGTGHSIYVIYDDGVLAG